MGENTKIEWTDHTFNPWRGCTKVSPGCAHCYAETLSKRNPALLGQWGKGKPRVLASRKMWEEPFKWNAESKERACFHRATSGSTHYRKPRVFCASLADWLDDEVDPKWLAMLLDLIHRTPYLDWLLLTKRPQNWQERIGLAARETRVRGGDMSLFCAWGHGQAPANVWIGTSVEDQIRADERIPELLKIPAKVRFLSCEPMLGPLDLTRIVLRKSDAPDLGKPNVAFNALTGWHGGAGDEAAQIHWVICGGESGPEARPMHPDWATGVRDQCVAAGVPFFYKQWGEWFPGYTADEGFILDTDHGGEQVMDTIGERRCAGHEFDAGPDGTYAEAFKVGKKSAGRILDGREWNEFPQ